MDKSDITIVIPAYNEEKGIGNVLLNLKKLVSGYQLLVIDDGSIAYSGGIRTWISFQ